MLAVLLEESEVGVLEGMDFEQSKMMHLIQWCEQGFTALAMRISLSSHDWHAFDSLGLVPLVRSSVLHMA